MILITGASSGIGRALAIEGARRGFGLILVARRTDRLVELKNEILKSTPGLRVDLLSADVSAADFEQRLKSSIPQEEKLEFVFVNAGQPSAGRFERLTTGDFQRNLDVNVLGAIKTAHAAIDALKQSKGTLVFIGSMNSHLPLPLGSPYNVSKFAVRGLAETLRTELAADGITVVLSSPGPVQTEILTKNNQGQVVSGGSFAKGRGLPADVAARRLFIGAGLRLRDFTIDPASGLLMLISRHLPGFTSFLMRVVFKRFRTFFLKLVGEINPDAV